MRLLSALNWALLVSTVTSSPGGSGSDIDVDSTSPPCDVDQVTNDINVHAGLNANVTAISLDDLAPVELLKRAERSPELRILPLGASIVYGMGSSNGNGFRGPLREALRSIGFEVNMVGTRKDGAMKDSDHEGTSGAIVAEIRGYMRRSLGYKPNVVVINAGTNDCNRAIDVNNIGQRMRGLLEELWGSPGMADTCVMLSTLLQTSDSTGSIHRISANQQYRDIVTQYAAWGRCIFLADMDPPSPSPANGWIPLSQIPDGIHPNDEGFRKMAYIFYKAILDASEAGRIGDPGPEAEQGSPGCDKGFGNGIWSRGLTQVGSGYDDGTYSYSSEYKGKLFSITTNWDRNQWRFVRLFNDRYDDLVGWYDRTPEIHGFGVWKNEGGTYRRLPMDIDPDIYCIPRGLHFIDMNADGLDDLVCIDPDGNLLLAINQGDGSGDRPPTFKRASATGRIFDNVGYKQDRVRLADIDGDGRGDYCIIDDGGNIQCWRNGWVRDMPSYWQPLGTRFTSKNMGDMRGVRFEDINGDGRSDWLWVSDVGETHTWTNSRSCLKGDIGNGLNVAWRQGHRAGSNEGPTHTGMGDFGNRDTGLRDRIHFARVFGEAQDFGLLSKMDYVYMEHTELDDGRHNFDVHVWQNKGSGATKLKADGNKYCNMMGHTDGRMDYVWTHSQGKMSLWPNEGRTDMSNGGSPWGTWHENIWDPTRSIGRFVDRRDIHLTDWDGDGVCDIVYSDPGKNNGVMVWLNKYAERGKWEWDFIENPAPALHCDERRGVAIQDLAVRFADITGNGRGDYLCLEKDGRVTGFVHKSDGTWENVNQIKFAEERDRANIRWADVNGDGRDDLLWVDKFTGDAFVSYNRGRGRPEDLSGSSFEWQKINDAVFDGSYAGTCQFFPDLDGNGRADLHSIMGTFTNQAETWYNPSCGLEDNNGDEPNGPTDPMLPQQPGNESDEPPVSVPGGDGPTYEHPSQADNDYPLCDASFDSLEELADASDNIDPYCGPIYAIELLIKELGQATERYNEIMSDGYDKYFDIYSEYLVSNSLEVWYSFMRDHGNEYFDCTVTEENPCCTNCEYLGVSCNHCNQNCEIENPWDDGVRIGNFSQGCPPDMSQRGMGQDWEKSVYWYMREEDNERYYDNATNEIGAPRERFVDKDHIGIPRWSPSYGCAQDRAKNGFWGMSQTCRDTGSWYNLPVVEGFEQSDVANPKEIVSEGLVGAAGLVLDLAATLFEIKAGMWRGNPVDVVDATAMPIFMISESLEMMEQIVEMGEEIEEARKKAAILLWLSAVFFIIPTAGAALGPLGFASLGRALVYIGEGANIGMGIYGIVQNPKTAPLAMFGFILSGRSIRDAHRVVLAAKARRDMPHADIVGFSQSVARKVDYTSLVASKARFRDLCMSGALR